MKPSPNVPTAKPPIATALRNGRKPLPAAERLLLLGRESLAATLLAQRAAGPKAEVEVVEDFGRLVAISYSESIASFARARTHPACFRSSRGYTRGLPGRGGARPACRPRAARGGRRVGRSGQPRTPRGARPGGVDAALARGSGGRSPGESRPPVHISRPVHVAVAGVRARLGDDRADVRVAGAARRRSQLGAAVPAPERSAQGRAAPRRRRASRAGGRPARTASSCSTTT